MPRAAQKKRKTSEALPGGDGAAAVHVPDAVVPNFEGDFNVAPAKPGDFDREDLLGVYRRMLTSRRLDEKMLTLLKQGKGFFHIGCAGHEAAQAAISSLCRPGHDWFSLYYRDLSMYLGLGATEKDVLLHHMAKADDPNSGGRQMAEHYSWPERNILPVSSSVGAQFLPGVGVALALQKDGSDAFCYVSCGDGATSQGDFHEALNWAARSKAPVLFVVQDNKYAISVPVSEQTAGGTAFKLARGYEGLKRVRVDGTDFFATYAVAKAAIESLRAGEGPVCLVADTVRLLPHSSSDNHTKYRTPEELDQEKTQDPISRFEQTLLDAGILEAAEIKSIRAEVAKTVDAAAAWAAKQPDPESDTALKHVYFEGDDGLEYEASTPAGEPVVMVDAINHALHEEMERNDRMLVYGEDVAGGKGGVFTATRDLTSKFGRDRCFNSPLAEASIIGTAVGFASKGYMPVVEIQFGDYIWPALQQIRNQVASYRYRSNGTWGCPMVIRVPVGGYIHGGLCHSQNIEAFFGHMPGLLVALPSNAADAKGLLKTAIRGQDPVLFMEHKALYRAASARRPEPDADYLLPFGKAAITREGSDLTIVTYGAMVAKAVNAARQLDNEGVSVEIIDLRTIMPLDMDTVLNSVRKTNRALVLYEDHEFLGFGAEIAAQLADKAFGDLDAPVRRVAGKFAPIAFADPLERALLPNDDDVLTAARELAGW
ncbi:MAG: dehydrogenase E1 component subunit alpha/beta [Rhodothermales bacterium]|nr:dehydrogenase E1 component subunit alpha/beta [Rhodothermales bacterium]MBO6780886.1 dehydrogenase E1 component subunit alpha/beta [Rhodothermales bacterium]